MPNQPEQKRLRLVAIACCAGLLLVGASLVFVFVLSRASPLDSVTDITEASFATDEKRREFLNAYAPFPIPSGIADIRIKYVSWLDWNLDASFVLPPDMEEAFLGQLRQIDPRGSMSFSFQTKTAVGKMTVRNRTVTMKCSNPVP
jgi:hypothetical protein